MPSGRRLAEAKAAHDAGEHARSDYEDAVDLRRRAIGAALDAGATAAEVAKELGMTATRVTQIAKRGREVRRGKKS